MIDPLENRIDNNGGVGGGGEERVLFIGSISIDTNACITMLQMPWLLQVLYEPHCQHDSQNSVLKPSN